jgi:hypothetical protein
MQDSGRTSVPDKGTVFQVFERLLDFFLGVHDKRPVPGDGFIQGFARN